MAGPYPDSPTDNLPAADTDQASQLTAAFLRDQAVKELFSQYLTSSWRDLQRFAAAFLNSRQNANLRELAAAAANIVDIAAVREPVTSPAFERPLAVLRTLYRQLQDATGQQGPPDLLESAYARALAERESCLQQYFRVRPQVAALLLRLVEAESHADLSTLAEQVHNECCRAMLELLGGGRALLYYRKDKAFDLANTTFEPQGPLCAVVAMCLQEPQSAPGGLDDEARSVLERELKFLAGDTTQPTRGIHAVPELAAVLDGSAPVLMLADARHYEMILDQARQHFPPMLLPLEFLMSAVYHRKYIQQQELPAMDELEQLPLDDYYSDPHWQFFRGGFCDYMARMTIPLGVSGEVFAFMSVDAFNRALGTVDLDQRARGTLRDYELYRRRRKTAQVEHLPGWLRTHEPALVRTMLAAVPDAIKNEDDFLRHRALDFMDSDCARRFFAYLQDEFGIRFSASSDDIKHLYSHFRSAPPVSRQLSRFAMLLGADIAAALAALNALAVTETKAHRAALIHVNKERNLTSRTLRHEGINKLTAMRNAVLDLNDYLLALDQAWKHYVEDFGVFSEQYIDDQLYEQLGRAVKPLYNLLEERYKSLEAIKRCNNIGRDLNDLLLRYKGAEFRKGDELIHALIDEVLDMYSELYFVGSRIEVVRDYCDPALKVVCYRDLLITVFCAYLDNAYEALLKTEGQRRIEISTAVAGDFLHFSIADSGCGFQDKPAIAAQPMLLYSGYTSKGGEGHGVGLTIVREIIEDVEFHNGQLDVPSSEPGRTTFGFAIPLESTRAVHVRT